MKRVMAEDEPRPAIRPAEEDVDWPSRTSYLANHPVGRVVDKDLSVRDVDVACAVCATLSPLRSAIGARGRRLERSRSLYVRFSALLATENPMAWQSSDEAIRVEVVRPAPAGDRSQRATASSPPGREMDKSGGHADDNVYDGSTVDTCS